MLTVFGQIAHGLDDLLPSQDVPTLDHPDTELITVARLVIIAAEAVTLTTGNLLPQITDRSRLSKVAAHLCSVEKESRMDVESLVLTLLD